MNEYVNSFKETKYMLCEMKNVKLLKKHNIWAKLGKNMDNLGKAFETKPVFDRDVFQI